MKDQYTLIEQSLYNKLYREVSLVSYLQAISDTYVIPNTHNLNYYFPQFAIHRSVIKYIRHNLYQLPCMIIKLMLVYNYYCYSLYSYRR